MALTVAWTRSLTSSLSNILATWALDVCKVTPISAAISTLDLP